MHESFTLFFYFVNGTFNDILFPVYVLVENRIVTVTGILDL